MKISLIGMPGVGKSVVGATLSQMHNLHFIDSDDLLEAQYKKSLYDLLESLGDEAFLAAEEAVLLGLEFADSLVVATGGSAVYSQPAMEYLGANSTVVYLEAPAEILKQRIDYSARGIVGARIKAFEDVYTERAALYETFANHTVRVGDKSLHDIVEDIITTVG